MLNKFSLKKRFFSLVIHLLIIIFINLIMNGCYATREASLGEEELEVTKIELVDSTIIDFSDFENGVGYKSEDNIVAFKNDSTIIRYPGFMIKKMYTEETDVGKTILTATGITALTIIIGAFIYTTNQPHQVDKQQSEYNK